MIEKIVDFALENRFLILAMAFLLLVWGAISFHLLPVEAYPDVANNYVDIITQWPGISAEQIEQQVTIPLEVTLAGMPGLKYTRSKSLFGLSHGIIDQAQYSALVAAVIGSAVIPTLIANAFYLPRHLLPELAEREADAMAQQAPLVSDQAE